MTLSLYLHIPFCEVKCGYCDFYSIPIKGRYRGDWDFELQKAYVDALIREIDQRAPEFSGRPVRSIFFGGGTPSLLDPRLMERIISRLADHFSWSEETEMTLEANPKTVSLERLKAFRSMGFNRISIGVQSFQERFLKALGRIHTGGEAKRTVEEARQAGFKNVSIDLIFALPGQSFTDWRRDLEEGIALETSHLSAYHLTIESGTPFAQIYGVGATHASPRQNLPAEEEGVRMMTWTRHRACQARLQPYEISNFSRPGFESIHNQNYWRYGEYLGFGTAAASFVGSRRRTNIRNLKKYLAGDWKGFTEEISPKTAMGEFCMLALRTREGIRKREFEDQFGRPVVEVFSRPIEMALRSKWLTETPEGWSLTEKGILFSDEVAVSFLP